MQTPIPDMRDPPPAQVHSPLAAPARTLSSAAAIPAACQTPIRLAPSVTFLGSLQFRGQMICNVARSLRHVHQPPVSLTPRPRVSQSYFPHPLQNRLP